MCFYIHQDHQEEKVATENIVCWKYLSKDKKAPIQNFQYEYNKLNKLDRVLSVRDGEIYFGFHSYSRQYKANKAAGNSRGQKAFKFIIPIGAKFYCNPDNDEYVSDQIVLLNPWYNQSIAEYFRNLRNS